MSRLRIALPPLQGLTLDCTLEFARLGDRQQVVESGTATLRQLGASGRERIECFLHPADSLLTRLALPPLPAARVGAAVQCAVQALALSGSEQLHVAHGRRSAEGQVQLSWMAKTALSGLAALLSESGLKLVGLYPAAYRLALPLQGQVAVCREDQHLLLRHDLEHAAIEPMADEHLQRLHASGQALQHLEGEQRWNGPLPGWGLQGAIARSDAQPQTWGRALACCCAALGIWVLGLNLYAADNAQEGLQIKAQMSQRVQQAFPHLPVILNPLQQARQQLAARASGAGTGPTADFASRVRNAADALPFMAGSVQHLTYQGGQLQLALASDAPARAIDHHLLASVGLSATREGAVWTFSDVPDNTPPESDHE